ncbi:putative uncharacterized protein DDB_G0282133 [Ooceraea biroi]|nr:putative uncharacterized protein DDB_G0282133 [Ooceraea biroi]
MCCMGSSLIVLTTLGCILWKFLLRKWYYCKRNDVECVEFNNDNAVATNANAPPEEYNPFIESKEEKLTIENDNNKVVAIDKLVGATAWRTPNWVSNANYGTNRLGDDDDDDDDFNPPNQGNNVIAQVPPVRNVPNTNVPNNSTAGQLAITMPESTADQDNARNIVLQTYMYNYERNTDGNIDNEDTDNNDTDNNADSNTDLTPEPNENGNKHNGKKSMLINQMLKNITMNVNVINVNDVAESRTITRENLGVHVCGNAFNETYADKWIERGASDFASKVFGFDPEE